MTIAQRIREYRYAKGWGPDELASRADISRTALYQIESGKTELPRASTLRRIAVALDVPMDALLDHETLSVFATSSFPESSTADLGRPLDVRARRRNGSLDPGAHGEGAESLPSLGRFNMAEPKGQGESRLSASRQRDLLKMFADVLDSSIGESVARIVEESYRILQRESEVERS